MIFLPTNGVLVAQLERVATKNPGREFESNQGHQFFSLVALLMINFQANYIYYLIVWYKFMPDLGMNICMNTCKNFNLVKTMLRIH